MGGEVRVSFPRLQQYSTMCEQQDGYVAAVDGLVNGSCANFGAFTGFMALFKGAYSDAHATVAASMDDARKAAQGASSAFLAVKGELEAADAAVQGDIDKVKVKVEAPSAYDGPGAPGSPGGVPGEVKYVNGVAQTVAGTTDTMAGGVNSVDHGIRGLPTDGLDLAANVTDTMTTGIGMGETDEDIRDYEEFEDEHGGDT